jgi:hypothetical protein
MNFLGVSLTLYVAGHFYMFVFHNKIIKPTIRCPYCRQYISETVSSCNLFEAVVSWLTYYRRFAVAIVQRGRMEEKMSPKVRTVFGKKWLTLSQV